MRIDLLKIGLSLHHGASRGTVSSVEELWKVAAGKVTCRGIEHRRRIARLPFSDRMRAGLDRLSRQSLPRWPRNEVDEKRKVSLTPPALGLLREPPRRFILSDLCIRIYVPNRWGTFSPP